jgi:hypothetical protein
LQEGKKYLLEKMIFESLILSELDAEFSQGSSSAAEHSGGADSHDHMGVENAATLASLVTMVPKDNPIDETLFCSILTALYLSCTPHSHSEANRIGENLGTKKSDGQEVPFSPSFYRIAKAFSPALVDQLGNYYILIHFSASNI